MVALLQTEPDDGNVRGDDVREAYRAARAAAVRALELFAQFDAQSGWASDGAASAISWLTNNAGITQAEAAREVRNARLMERHREVAVALQTDMITPSHLNQLGSIARHRSRRFGDDVTVLVESASRLEPERFRRVAHHWRALADDVLTAEERDERNWLDLAQSYSGSWILRGILDPVRGAALQSLLVAGSAPTDAGDPRSAAERRADALFSVLTGGEPVEARVDVLVDVDTFVGADRPLEAVRRELQDSSVLERIVMQRLACTPAVGRVLTRGKHEVLELGRQTRLATRALRRAVIARDGSCAWPGCDRPPAMCEVHHLEPWQNGGETNLDNLALLCGHHHTRVHRGWRITQESDGSWSTSPP